MRSFDIAIIGGGHAGIEAANIAAQFGLEIAILTMPGVSLASTPCNPAIGGVGKGQVVREIDAIGGLMGKIADRAGIQYRTLNESKGYAVQSTRVQVDKDIYSATAEKLISEKANVTVIRECVDGVVRAENGFKCKTDGDLIIFASKIVITTGTFLGGVLHTGEEQSRGGRIGNKPGKPLENLFSEVKTLSKRFKTGTPPRLDAGSLDFSKFELQESDPQAFNFHWGNEDHQRCCEQVSCFLTRTNERTLEIIRQNKHRSPIFNGQIKGVGPRYCPSIEDKAFRYLDRNIHHVFVEPEGLSTNSIYPNGISTSLPKEVQQEFVRTIPGLENAEILVHGYAVEYDVVDTSKLSLTLEYTDIPGLYFAGQVNGTSGYEEAAGQGLIAGANAALALLKKEPLILDRRESYIGVMVEDLVSNKRDEPYRLFTARAENRLYIREDNTYSRIAPYRLSLGLNLGIDKFLKKTVLSERLLYGLAEEYVYRATSHEKDRFRQEGYGGLDTNIRLKELITRGGLDPVATLSNELDFFGLVFEPNVIRSVAISLKYSGYICRANSETAKLQKLAVRQINLEEVVNNKNISNECRQRIKDCRPQTFGQLQRIDGIRPATLALIAGSLS